jgi:hypothetical protein
MPSIVQGYEAISPGQHFYRKPRGGSTLKRVQNSRCLHDVAIGYDCFTFHG